MKVAVFDIGSMKVKFLVANVRQNNTYRTIYESNTLTCLGLRMQENDNKPHEQYVQDTIAELKRCTVILEKEKVKKIRAVSTHALREMGETGKQIASRIEKQTGLTVEIISQKEEADIFFQAVTKDFTASGDFTIVDVGGGSVQVLIGNKTELKDMYLLNCGAQYLFDRYSPRHSGEDFPTREEIRDMKEHIMNQLLPLPENIHTPVIYGSSCIIDVFKALGLPLEPYGFSKSHPYKTKIQEVRKLLASISTMPYDEREKTFAYKQQYYMWGIDKALLNILHISKKVDAPYIIPSNANVNQGLVLSLAQK